MGPRRDRAIHTDHRASQSSVCLAFSSGPEFSLRALETLAVEEGHSAIPSEKWLDQLPHSSQSTPILALSSRPNGTIARDTAAYVGRAVASVQPGDSPPWYTIPGPSASKSIPARGT